MFDAGTKIEITKGLRARRIQKGERGTVVVVRHGGAEFGHAVFVTIRFETGWVGGKTLTFQVRHKNRLADTEVQAHTGNPTQKIRFRITRLVGHPTEATRAFLSEILKNTDDLFAGKIDHDTHRARNKALWDRVREAGAHIEAAVLAGLRESR